MINLKKIIDIKEDKKFKTVMTVIRILVIIILICFIIVVCLQRFSDNKISFFNYRLFTVVSGSMKPKYDIGDVLIAKDVEPSTIKVGDTISYQGIRGGFKDKVITHQVIGIKMNENGEYIFRAKGLANLIEDPAVHENQLYGVVIYKSILLSIIYRIVATDVGFLLFIFIPMLYIIGSEIITTLLEKEEAKRKKITSNG